MNLSDFIKQKRKAVRLSQPELAEKACAGLGFIRELEQGKEMLRVESQKQRKLAENAL